MNISKKKNQKKVINYRPDIDGLRALAVLSVVLYHAFPSYLQGGFVGVDIFFVISGFLITSILLKELNNDDFKFSDFYLRRFNRIFPSLIVVLIFSFL
ncbi:acyltransferase family protein [Vibrio cholerae]|uniref:acyltransferase family protein n=1 Tax=Vibrio cholerae TaxID=666 RepID=UPI00227D7BD6|nr:acyltransferase [Vibrio cholerae]